MNIERVRRTAIEAALKLNPRSVSNLIDYAILIENFMREPSHGPKKSTIDNLSIEEKSAQSVAFFAQQLKFPSPEGIRSITPYDQQLDIFESWQKDKHVYIDSARRMGTTTALLTVALHDALFEPGRITAFVAYSSNEIGQLMTTLRVLITNLPQELAQKYTIGTWSIDFANGSSIWLLGPDLTKITSPLISNLIIDQVSFISKTRADYLVDTLLPKMASHTADYRLYLASSGGGWSGNASYLLNSIEFVKIGGSSSQ